MAQDTSGCDTCNKKDLSLIVGRPSLVANDPRLVPAGANAVTVEDALLEGVVPKRKPTQSRYVLRLLREGYLYLYIPEPPEGIKPWRVFRVTADADLIPEEHGCFPQHGKTVPCNSTGHIPMGLKIADIPASAEVTTIWLAWSANLWNAKTRAQNAANPKAMKKIVIGGDNSNTFEPTAENLTGKVLECALPELNIKGSREHDYPFKSLAGQVGHLVKRLKMAAAANPGTEGRQLAVILPDFAGLAIDANALRLHRHELAELDVQKPDIAHPLNSNNVLLGLKKVVIDEVMARGFEAVCPIMHKGAFDDIMRVKPNPRGWPAGTTWEPLPATPQNTARHGPGMGAVILPDFDERMDRNGKWVRAQVEAQWSRMTPKYYDEDARQKWLTNFKRDMKTRHYDELAKYEHDWWEIRKDEGFNNTFALHYDPLDPNDPKKHVSPGRIYAQEVTLATTPAPLTDELIDDYLAELTHEVTEPSAVMLRALGGNQSAVLAKIDGALKVQIAVNQLHGERNDKLYDLSVGLVEAIEPNSPHATMRMLARYSWLTKGMGDVFCGYTFSIAQGLDSVVMRKIASLAGGAMVAGRVGDTKLAQKLLERLQGALLVQRTAEMALESMVAGHGLKTPMQITKDYRIGEALVHLSQRGGTPRAHLLNAQRGGMLRLVFLTDNQEMAAFKGDIDKALASGAGSVELPARPTPALLKPSALAATVALSDAHYAQLWQRGGSAIARGAQYAETAITHGRVALGSLEGRLGLGVMLINGAGLAKALNDLDDKDARKVRNAWVGLTDSTASVIGGATLIMEVTAASSIAARIGKDAVHKSVGIHTLRFYGNLMGTVAGMVNAYGQWAKAGDAQQDGLEDVAYLYRLSAISFFGTGSTSLLLTGGALADRQLAKGIANAALRKAAERMAMRYGAEGAAALMGISVSGWGLILLGLALAFEVGAVILSPDELQKWVARSYFGTGVGADGLPKFDKGDWAAEKAALDALMAPPDKKDAEGKAA